MKVERRAPGPAYANLQWRCYGAGVGEDIASVDVDVNRWSTPHAEVERPEPIPYASQTGSHADRRDRDEPFELARCGDCGIERQPLKKLEVDESTLLKLLIRWREEAKKSGHSIE